MATPFDDNFEAPQNPPDEEARVPNPFVQTSNVEENAGAVEDVDQPSLSVKVEGASAVAEPKDSGSNEDLLGACGGASPTNLDQSPEERQASLLRSFGHPVEGPSSRGQDITVSVESVDDPVHGFLQREQELFGSFNDSSVESVVGSSPCAPSTDLYGSFDVTSRGTSYGPSPIPQYPPSQGTSPVPPTTSPSALLPSTSVEREIPDPIRKAEQEMKERLEKKDAEEAAEIQKLRENARAELDEWYAKYRKELEKTKARHRGEQDEFEKDRDSECEKGKEWERVGNMCNFGNRAQRGGRDVSRMKSILMQLKQKPPPDPKPE